MSPPGRRESRGGKGCTAWPRRCIPTVWSERAERTHPGAAVCAVRPRGAAGRRLAGRHAGGAQRGVRDVRPTGQPTVGPRRTPPAQGRLLRRVRRDRRGGGWRGAPPGPGLAEIKRMYVCPHARSRVWRRHCSGRSKMRRVRSATRRSASTPGRNSFMRSGSTVARATWRCRPTTTTRLPASGGTRR